MAGKKSDLEIQVENEFLEEARDIMNQLEVQRENLRSNFNSDDMAKLRRNVQLLGAQAHAADFGIVSLLSHRLEDYLERIDTMADPHGDNVRMFLDKIEGRWTAPSKSASQMPGPNWYANCHPPVNLSTNLVIWKRKISKFSSSFPTRPQAILLNVKWQNAAIAFHLPNHRLRGLKLPFAPARIWFWPPVKLMSCPALILPMHFLLCPLPRTFLLLC